MPFYEADTIGRAMFKYLVVGATCFAIGYIKGCEHGKAMVTPPSRIEATVQNEISNKPFLTKIGEKNVRPSYSTN